MTDNIEEFITLLQKSSLPEPGEDAKKDALSQGLTAFDKKYSTLRQGNALRARLMEAVRIVHNALAVGNPMKKIYVVAGIGVLSLAVFNSGYFSERLPPQVKGEAIHREHVAALRKDALQSDDSLGTPGSLPAPPVSQSFATSPVAAPAPADLGGVRREMDALHAPLAQTQSKETADEKSVADAPRQKEQVAGKSGGPDFTIAPGSLPSPPPGFIPSPVPGVIYEGNAAALDAARRARAFHNEQNSPFNVIAKNAKTLKNPYDQTAATGSVSIGGYAYPLQQSTPPLPESRDNFEHFKSNADKQVREEPVSTFCVDVDTSSYSFLRASLNRGTLPPPDAVRIQELINYFPYAYEAPKNREEPFKTTASVFQTPWNKETKLLHIGIKGYEVPQREKPHSNLVFLLDTSGSMNDPVRLPLVVNSMKLLLDSLKADDTVAIVTYAGYAGVALPPTPVSEKAKIVAVLNGLYASGSTAGFDGLQTAYRLAEEHYDPHSVNRVILSTDGDFNVGITDQDELKRFVGRERDKGIFLSVLGVGMGNYNDSVMQSLAKSGNGLAAYIDNLNEARKVLVEEAGSTLLLIAKDVKIQVEFNPARVAQYRLIGYESGILNREDFNNDKVGGGEVGSGHAVTALYEITPVGSKSRGVDALRYQKPVAVSEPESGSGEYAFVKIRYTLPEGTQSQLSSQPVDGRNEYKPLATAPQDALFAAAVAAFGQLLKGEGDMGAFTYDDVIALARAARGTDTFGYRAEFINLVELARHEAGSVAPPLPIE